MLDHQVDLVGDFASKGYLVGDDDAGHAMFRELADGDQTPSVGCLRELATRDSVRLAETLFALGDVAPSWKI